jgi:hypothetical protein
MGLVVKVNLQIKVLLEMEGIERLMLYKLRLVKILILMLLILYGNKEQAC